MQITEEIYKDLSKRIEAGEFLRNVHSVSLPDLPDNANEEMKKYQEDCQNTLDLYQAKLNAMDEQIASMRKIMDEKEVTDRANLLVKDFDSKLEKEYQQYKDTSEEKIKKLREDLAEAKEISSNALKRCDEYNSQTIQLQEEIKRLEKSIEEKDEQIASLQTDFLNGYVLETNGKAAGLLEKGDEGESDLLLQKKDEEIANLKETLGKAVNDAKVEVATVMVESGVAYLSNIKRVTKDEEVSFGERLLKNMVSGDCISHIGQQAIDKLRNKISYITDYRDEAEEKLETLSAAEKKAEKQKADEQEQARQELSRDRNTVLEKSIDAIGKAMSRPTVNIKQVVTGEGNFLEGPPAFAGTPLPPSE